jgi:hypothetical protein
MSDQCSAIKENGSQCRASGDLVRAQVTGYWKNGNLKLPDQVVVLLCPKHFVMTRGETK